MSKIEIGRWSSQLRRMFGMAGVVDVSTELAPEVSPVIVLEEPTVDLFFLKELRQIFAGDALSGGVGFTSKWRMRNPAGSGVIAVIQAIEMVPFVTADMAIRINVATGDFTVPVDTAIPDPRWNALNVAGRRSTIVISSETTGGVPSGDTIAESRRLIAEPWLFFRPIPLLPGVTLDFGTESSNVDIRMWVEWTERSFPVLEQ